MWLPVDEFLCPRSPVPWRGLLLGLLLRPPLPGLPSAAHAQLSLSRQQDGPVPGTGSHLDACPRCSFSPSELGLPVCGWQVVERPQGLLALTLISVLQRQLPQLSLAEGVGMATGLRPGWAPGR